VVDRDDERWTLVTIEGVLDDIHEPRVSDGKASPTNTRIS